MSAAGRDRAPLLLRLSVRFLPADVRDEVLGDLGEHWNAGVKARPRLRRAVWLLRQPLEVMASRLRYGSSATDGVGHGGGLRPARHRGFGFSWLDFKLGFRMLVRHPGLTVVATLAMAFGIAVGTVAFELGKDVFAPKMPYGAEGIVRLWNVDVRTGSSTSFLHDFAVWRDELRSVDALAAYDEMERNLSMEGGPDGPVAVLAVSAAAFDLLPVSPLIGRPLLPSDEAAGAPAVALIGYDLWQGRFAGDPGVLGRVARLSEEPTIVVGVMPEGFALGVEGGGLDLHRISAATRSAPSSRRRAGGDRDHLGRSRARPGRPAARGGISAPGAGPAPSQGEKWMPRPTNRSSLWTNCP